MTDRIGGFGKKPDHARTPSERTGEKPTPRASQLSEEAKKRHTRVSSLSWRQTGRSSGEGFTEIPATPRKLDDQDFADDRGSESEAELKRTVDFESDTMELPRKMPPLPRIPPAIPRLKMPQRGDGVDPTLKRKMFAHQTFLTDLRAVKTRGETTPRTSLPGVAKKPKPLPALPPGSPRSDVKKSGKPLPEPPSSPRAKPQEKPLASSSSEKKT